LSPKTGIGFSGSLNEKDLYGHYALSMSYLFSGAIDQSGQAAEKALDLSPTFALAHLGVGLARLYSVGAVQPVERGLRLNPFDPQNFLWFRTLALAYSFSLDPGKGIAGRSQGAQARPTWRPAVEAMMICHVALGDHENARRRAEQSRQLVKTGQRCLGSVEAPQSALGEGRCRCAPGGRRSP